MLISRLLIYILIGVGGLGLTALIWASIDSRRVGKRLAEVLHRLEEHYEDFVRDKINLDLLASDNPDIAVDSVLRDALKLLEPEMDALVAGINSSSYTDLRINPGSDFLQNVALVAESVNKARGTSSKQLSREQIGQLHTSLEKALRSDLLRRQLNLKAGNL